MLAFSFGGGVQSTAALVLSAQRALPYRVHVFADVGEDSEHPDAVNYIKTVAQPFAKANGIELVTVRKSSRRDDWESIYAKLQRTATSIDIPVRMANGAPGRRSCTQDYKVLPVARWFKEQGATPEFKGVVGIGISTDESERMRDSRLPYLINTYPLIDLRLSRDDCKRIIRDAGLPPAPRSACWFCPFQKMPRWLAMRSERPDLWAKCVELEQSLNQRRQEAGKLPVYLTGAGVPLLEAVERYQQKNGYTEVDTEAFSCGPFSCAAGTAQVD